MAIYDTNKQPNMAAALPGYEHIRRYYDRGRNNIIVAKLLPGQYYVTAQDEMITTVLGSCISVCVSCPALKIGGMNHFMLPGSDSSKKSWKDTVANDAARYGIYAMEQLINDVLKNGARRSTLVVKVFGGGKMMASMADIGQRNIAFAKEFLQKENIKVIASDVGDIYPRKVNFFPANGKVMVKKLKSLHNRTILEREQRYRYEIEHQPVAGDIELF